MIRFCDKEVCCVSEDNLDRQQLIRYFLDGHRNDRVCILDDAGRFVSQITYDSLLGKELEEAKIRDYVILDASVWENGKRYFKSHMKLFGSHMALPVLNRKHQLICFAYEDYEANREMRMLDELMETDMALGFKDVYPEFDCVTIYDCNELAWAFARYLKRNHTEVRLLGEIWKELNLEETFSEVKEALDYKTYAVYAEGTGVKEEKIEWRKSVSVQFECIDRIYEENIRKGFILDAEEEFGSLLKQWREKELCILGAEESAWNAYDFLLQHNLDIACFVSGDPDMQGKRLFGKDVYTKIQAVEAFEDAVFIETDAKYSAWGFGSADYFHYRGYKRNERFFLIRDYVELPQTGFFHLFYHRMRQPENKIVLFGDLRLCLRLKQILESKNPAFLKRVVYCDILEEYTEFKDMEQIAVSQVKKEDTLLLLLPDYYGYDKSELYQNGYRAGVHKKYARAFERFDLLDYVDYPLYPSVFTERAGMEGTSEPVIGKILLGSIDYFSGNTFFKGLLDEHPSILMLPYNYLCDNLYSICIRLAMERGSDILPLFWKMYREPAHPERTFLEKERFDEIMGGMLSEKEYFTSQELFVIIHVSYAKMKGREIKDLSEMMIYWEPHEVSRDVLEEYAVWLKTACASGYIVNVVRNAYMTAGSFLRWRSKKDSAPRSRQQIFSCVVQSPPKREKEYDGFQRIVFRFEDLKCRPKEELMSFCSQCEIPWSDSLLDVSQTGTLYSEIKGFDLMPVYRSYEEYFSAFDRFRMTLIAASWQRAHGYSYVCSQEFSRKELSELFQRQFQMEKEFVFRDKNEEESYWRWRNGYIMMLLWENHREEFMCLSQKP